MQQVSSSHRVVMTACPSCSTHQIFWIASAKPGLCGLSPLHGDVAAAETDVCIASGRRWTWARRPAPRQAGLACLQALLTSVPYQCWKAAHTLSALAWSPCTTAHCTGFLAAMCQMRCSTHRTFPAVLTCGSGRCLSAIHAGCLQFQRHLGVSY